MDIGLVCDRCEALCPMSAASCSSCGASLSLDRPRAAAPAAAPARQAAGPPGQRACAQCGTPLAPGFRFCGACGAKADSPPARAERRTMFFGAMQAARAKLVLIKGDGLDGVSFTLAGKEHVAGRAEGPLLFPDDPFLSPRHACFYYQNEQLCVRDEGSTNGVFLRIRAPAQLGAGDTFLVGEQLLRVEALPPGDALLAPDDAGTCFHASPPPAGSCIRLVQLLRGGAPGMAFLASRDIVTIGRNGNDINFPDDPFISGRHAQVTRGESGLVLSDLDSRNGTFLRLRNNAALAHGDYVFLGQELLRVEVV